MFDAAQARLVPAAELARATPLTNAANGLRWASFGYTEVPSDSLQQIVEAVPTTVARPLAERAYYFVPLALGQADEAYDREAETEIAPGFTEELAERATCHRNAVVDGVERTFLSARLMQDKFALAFEFFINIGHQYVDREPVPARFAALVWSQARAEVRGETSQDAWETRRRALEAAPGPSAPAVSSMAAPAPATLGAPRSLFALRASASARRTTRPLSGDLFDGTRPVAASSAAQEQPPDESDAPDGARIPFYEAAFADALAIYMLSLAVDLDYSDLREREYPLLSAPALADRLRLAAELFPPPAGYEFAIRYRRRH